MSDFTKVDGNVYTAIFTANDGIEITGSVAVGSGYTDLAGNAGTGNSDTVAIDTLNPTVVVNIVASSLNDGSNSSLVSFQFSEDISGFDASDLTAMGGTLSDFTVLDGNSYTALFTTDEGIETIGSVTVGTDYTNLVGNAGTGGSDTVAIDTINPTVVVDIVASSLDDGDNSSLVSFEFSEDVLGLDAGDLTAMGGTLSNFTIVDGNSYTAIFTADDGIETTGSVAVGAGYTDPRGQRGVGRQRHGGHRQAQSDRSW